MTGRSILTGLWKSTLLGAVGGAIFVFIFPKGSITTFMHQVLHLPGPGAGIALVAGPFMFILALLGYRASRDTDGGLLAACISFSIVVAVLAALVAPMNPKGKFGTIWFILACSLGGVTAELALYRGKKLGLFIAGVVGNLALLVFYWLVIFPMHAGWVEWGDVPALLAVCVAGGMLAGLIAWLVSPVLLHYIDPHKEEDHVRTR